MGKKIKPFKELQKEWYAKLEKSGFQDIEKDGNLKWPISSRVTRTLNNNGTEGIQAKENYYRLAGHFLHEYDFDSNKDRFIWDCHAQGISIRDISVLLKKRRSYSAPTQVKEAIHRLRDEMFKRYKDENL